MSSKKAILTVGIPGSGKSHWAAKQDGYRVINLDDCRYLVSGDSSNQACTKEAAKIHERLIDLAVRDGVNIIVSDTNLNKGFRDVLEARLWNDGYTVEIKVFDTPYDVCVARNNTRTNPVPEHAMLRLQEQFIDNQPCENPSADDGSQP